MFLATNAAYVMPTQISLPSSHEQPVRSCQMFGTYSSPRIRDMRMCSKSLGATSADCTFGASQPPVYLMIWQPTPHMYLSVGCYRPFTGEIKLLVLHRFASTTITKGREADEGERNIHIVWLVTCAMSSILNSLNTPVLLLLLHYSPPLLKCHMYSDVCLCFGLTQCFGFSLCYGVLVCVMPGMVSAFVMVLACVMVLDSNTFLPVLWC